MSLARPAAVLTLTGGPPGVPAGPVGSAQAGALRITVELTVDESHDRVELLLGPGSPLADAEPGTVLTVALGDRDATEDVAAVEVAGVDATHWGTVLAGYAPSHRLSDVFVGRSYVAQTVADVVADLLSAGGVDAADVDGAGTLPALHVDPRRCVWGHLHALARRTGHQITSGATGAVSFTPAPGASGAAGAVGAAADAGELRAGAEVVTFRAGTRAPRTPLASVHPAGPARWYLLAAAPDPGSGDPVLVDPALRTRELADAASAGAAAAASRAGRAARMRVPGRPGLRAGAVVRARGADHRVLRVRHVVDGTRGFVTDLLLEGTA